METPIVEVEIDIRERELIEKLKLSNVDHNVVPLSLADIRIKYKETVLLFERKTLNDLKSSIFDGRFHEQIFRLKQNEGNSFIVVEGKNEKKMKTFNPNTRKTIESCLLSSCIKYKIPVLYTENVQGTADLIAKICEKKDRWYGSDVSYTPNDSDQLKRMSHASTYIKQLCCVKGVSKETAETIQTVFPDLYTFTSEATKEKLETIKFQKSNKKLSKNVINELLESIKRPDASQESP